MTQTEPARAPTADLWDALAHPVDPWSATEALLGLSSGGAHLLASILLLSSAEAEALLGSMHEVSRALTIGTSGRTERSNGEIRGPILWSETLSARSSGGGGTVGAAPPPPAPGPCPPAERRPAGRPPRLPRGGAARPAPPPP